MRHLFLSFICLTFLSSINAFAEVYDGSEPVASQAPDYSVSENFFKNHYVMTEGIRDMEVLLEGEWLNTDAYRLAQLLKQMDKVRPVRTASIHEFTEHRVLEFKVGDQFSFDQQIIEYLNPAAVFGAGISSTTLFRFQVPMNASDEELKTMMIEHLPARLEKLPSRLEAWQKSVAEVKRRGLCASLLSGLGLR